ncbi:hypothetical protein A2U01_0059416, partial [Trifolium medium]|nr:hypothetical protein [Trifolium medium]
MAAPPSFHTLLFPATAAVVPLSPSFLLDLVVLGTWWVVVFQAFR